VDPATHSELDDAPESLGRLVLLGLAIIAMVGLIAFVVGVLA
jgi:hypothetical protein